MSISRVIGKEAVVCIDNGILLRHEKEHIQVSSSEMMHLKPVIQTAVSQREKNKYHVLTHTYVI